VVALAQKPIERKKEHAIGFRIYKVMLSLGLNGRAGIAHWKRSRAASLTNSGSNPAGLPPRKYKPQGERIKTTPEAIKSRF
jgi:hypothetical protein